MQWLRCSDAAPRVSPSGEKMAPGAIERHRRDLQAHCCAFAITDGAVLSGRCRRHDQNEAIEQSVLNIFDFSTFDDPASQISRSRRQACRRARQNATHHAGDVAESIGRRLGQQVQKYEKGMNRVGAGRLYQIADILSVPRSFFFDGGPPISDRIKGAPYAPYVDDFLASRAGVSLVRAFTRINNAKLRRCIVAVVEQIAAKD